MEKRKTYETFRAEEFVTLYRKKNQAADRWAAGYGPVHHKSSNGMV